MDEPGSSWLFAAAVVVSWVAVWVSIEFLLRDGDLLGAGITGAVSGAAFVVFYAALRRV